MTQKTKFILGGIIFAIVIYLYISQSSKNISDHYRDTNQLCQKLSENHTGVKNLYEECMIEATEIYEKNHPTNQDDYDPYEDAQPGAYGPE